MNSPFGNNRGLGRTPRRPDRLQGAALQGPRRNHWRSAALGHLGRGCGGQNNASLDQHSSMRSSNYNAAPFEALNMRGGPCSFAG